MSICRVWSPEGITKLSSNNMTLSKWTNIPTWSFPKSWGIAPNHLSHGQPFWITASVLRFNMVKVSSLGIHHFKTFRHFSYGRPKSQPLRCCWTLDAGLPSTWENKSVANFRWRWLNFPMFMIKKVGFNISNSILIYYQFVWQKQLGKIIAP